MKRISLGIQVGGHTIPRDIAAKAFASMLPRPGPGGLVGHPAVLRLIDAARNQPLHPEYKRRLANLGATHQSLN
jgi:hypothetical protein